MFTEQGAGLAPWTETLGLLWCIVELKTCWIHSMYTVYRACMYIFIAGKKRRKNGEMKQIFFKRLRWTLFRKVDIRNRQQKEKRESGVTAKEAVVDVLREQMGVGWGGVGEGRGPRMMQPYIFSD